MTDDDAADAGKARAEQMAQIIRPGTSPFYDFEGNRIDDPFEWELLFSDPRRILYQTEVECTNGETCMVSTIWDGIDVFGHGREGPPLIYETAVFGGELSSTTERYATAAEAEAGHRKLVEACGLPVVTVQLPADIAPPSGRHPGVPRQRREEPPTESD